jgi:hypothetical protein
VLLGDDKKRLSARAIVKAGVVSEVLLDTTGNQYADTRQILSDGRLVRVDADTNNDHLPDVVQTYDGDALSPSGRGHRRRRRRRSALRGQQVGARPARHEDLARGVHAARLRQLRRLLVEAVAGPV